MHVGHKNNIKCHPQVKASNDCVFLVFEQFHQLDTQISLYFDLGVESWLFTNRKFNKFPYLVSMDGIHLGLCIWLQSKCKVWRVTFSITLWNFVKFDVFKWIQKHTEPISSQLIIVLNCQLDYENIYKILFLKIIHSWLVMDF